MDQNRIEAMRTLARNLEHEGQMSRSNCVTELCNEIKRLQGENELMRQVLKNWQVYARLYSVDMATFKEWDKNVLETNNILAQLDASMNNGVEP